MSRPKLLIGHPISKDRLEKLDERFAVECISSTEDKYKQVSDKIGDIQGLLAIAHPVDKPLIEKAKNLRIISNFGVGYDNIDVEAASARGIVVTNTPQTTAIPTADLTMGLILSLLRKIVRHDRYIRQEKIGSWSDPSIMGHSLAGKILGILGMGRIGKEVARRARTSGMKIIYHNRHPIDVKEATEFNARYVELPGLLQQADVLTIHTPLTDETFDMIGPDELNLMKPTAYLINTARGGIVKIDALIQALQNEKIAGAAMDVYPEEPQIPKELFKLDNVVLTPHIGTATFEDRYAMFQEAFAYLANYLMGEGKIARVN